MDRGGGVILALTLIEKPWRKPGGPAATSKMADAMCVRDKGGTTTHPVPAAETTASASRHRHAGKRAVYYLPQQLSKPATIAGVRKYPAIRPLPRAETELIAKCRSPA
ncbi:Hypothetical predicted protein [Pelobates cultripes]|uniref:Uncharacterized protein n=1 Tax=Pelobates cultripes TaxID=61616 RepID=A0AAD1R9U7_PELCU|nr:Hypothetical predicted protein [Pelobates cultripes]